MSGVDSATPMAEKTSPWVPRDETIDAALAHTKSALDILASTAKASPLPMIGEALATLSLIVGKVIDMRDNISIMRELKMSIIELARALERASGAMNRLRFESIPSSIGVTHGSFDAFSSRTDGLLRALKPVSTKLTELGTRSTLRRLFASANDKSQLKDLKTDIDNAKVAFMFGEGLDIEVVVNQILDGQLHRQTNDSLECARRTLLDFLLSHDQLQQASQTLGSISDVDALEIGAAHDLTATKSRVQAALLVMEPYVANATLLRDRLAGSPFAIAGGDEIDRTASLKHCSEEVANICGSVTDVLLKCSLMKSLVALEKKGLEVARLAKSRMDEREVTAIFNRIPRASGASYRAPIHELAHKNEWLQGTREALLAELDMWFKCEGPEMDATPFFILSGGAGTGKSTVAYEFARRIDQRRRLGATFFFVRNEKGLDTVDLVLTTVLRQMVHHFSVLRHSAVEAVRRYLDQLDPSFDDQADLFDEVCAKLPLDDKPILIVLDALDECRRESQQTFFPRLLARIMRFATEPAAPRIRVLVTTRPELHVERVLQGGSLVAGSRRFRMHEIDPSAAQSDIRQYFEIEFKSYAPALLVNKPRLIDELVLRANDLFVYAATSMRYLKDFHPQNAEEGIAIILQSRAAGPQGHLADLYLGVLDSVFPPEYLEIPGRMMAVRAVLAGIAILQDHVSLQTLAELTGIGSAVASEVLMALGTVVNFDSSNGMQKIRPLHASFAEFLVDECRCTNTTFLISASETHQLFAVRSLEHILSFPGMNTCSGKVPGSWPTSFLTPGSPTAGLGPAVHERYAESIQYCCVFWPVHVCRAKDPIKLERLLMRFCSTHLLLWMEALAALDQIHAVLESLGMLDALLGRCQLHHQIRRVLFDSFRLLLEFRPALIAQPEQLYRSALPLAPEGSTLKVIYGPLVLPSETAIRVITGVSVDWNPWLSVQVTLPVGRLTMVECVSPEICVAYGDQSAVLCDPRWGIILRSVDLSSAGARFSLRQVCVDPSGEQFACIVEQSDGAICVMVYDAHSAVQTAVTQLPGTDIPPIRIAVRGTFIQGGQGLLLTRSLQGGDSDGRHVELWHYLPRVMDHAPVRSFLDLKTRLPAWARVGSPRQCTSNGRDLVLTVYAEPDDDCQDCDIAIVMGFDEADSIWSVKHAWIVDSRSSGTFLPDSSCVLLCHNGSYAIHDLNMPKPEGQTLAECPQFSGHATHAVARSGPSGTTIAISDIHAVGPGVSIWVWSLSGSNSWALVANPSLPRDVVSGVDEHGMFISVAIDGAQLFAAREGELRAFKLATYATGENSAFPVSPSGNVAVAAATAGHLRSVLTPQTSILQNSSSWRVQNDRRTANIDWEVEPAIDVIRESNGYKLNGRQPTNDFHIGPHWTIDGHGWLIDEASEKLAWIPRSRFWRGVAYSGPIIRLEGGLSNTIIELSRHPAYLRSLRNRSNKHYMGSLQFPIAGSGDVSMYSALIPMERLRSAREVLGLTDEWMDKSPSS